MIKGTHKYKNCWYNSPWYDSPWHLYIESSPWLLYPTNKTDQHLLHATQHKHHSHSTKCVLWRHADIAVIFPSALLWVHYDGVIMSAMMSQITSLTVVYSTVYSGTNERKHQSSASLAFVQGIHWWPVNSPLKWPVTRKMCPFDDVIMNYILLASNGAKN